MATPASALVNDRQVGMTLSGSTRPNDVWVLDVAAGTFRQITFSPHPGVDLARLVKPELVHFRAHDGLELSGWLYAPPGVSGPAPYVLSFHGGPEGQERPAFRKLADPRRLGITGGSYGGYMTMAGVTEYPDLFAAGVNLFGIVNFATFFKHSEPWMAAISTVEYGDPATQADLLARLSPLHKLDRVRAALMVQHGANDTNVPVVEAEQVVASLKGRDVPVEYILFPDEGHGWRKVPNRIRSVRSMVEFFRAHLRPGS